MESPAGSKENHEPQHTGFDLSKAMESAATAMRTEPIPDSACLTPRNGKRKLPPPAPLLAALFGPDYQTMSPDPRLPPFNERISATSSALAGGTGPSAANTSGPSLLSAIRWGSGASGYKIPESLRQKLPSSLRRAHGPASATDDLPPGSGAAANASRAEAVAQDRPALSLAAGKADRDQNCARRLSVAAVGDLQAAILYAEAEQIMEFLQERKNCARIASDFDDKLSALCEAFCSSSVAASNAQAVEERTEPAKLAAIVSDVKQEVKPHPIRTSTNHSPGAGSTSPGAEQYPKRRRRPPAKHDGFCSTDGAAITAREEDPTGDLTVKEGGPAAKESSDGAQDVQQAGDKLDGAMAADHKAALYSTINDTLESLASRRSYKSGASNLRESVDRALLLCRQLEAGASDAGTMALEAVLSNPLPPAKFAWSRRHEALRLARLALQSLNQIAASGLGNFQLEVTFAPISTLRPAADTPPGTSGADAPAGTPSAQEANASISPSAHAASPQTLLVCSPGRVKPPPGAVATALHEKQDIAIQTMSESPVSAVTAADNKEAVLMDTNPLKRAAPSFVAANAAPGTASNGAIALSRSASCAMETDVGIQKGDVTSGSNPGAKGKIPAVKALGDAQGTPKPPGTSEKHAAVAERMNDDPSTLLHTFAQAAAFPVSDSGKAPGACLRPQPLAGNSPPAMAPHSALHDPRASTRPLNGTGLFPHWPMQLPQTATMPDGGVSAVRPAQQMPESTLAQVLGYGVTGAKNTAVEPAGSGAFPKVEPLLRPSGRQMGTGGAVTTDELMNAFDEASELRLRALGAVGGAMAGGRGGKRRRVDGGRTFHQSIGIGNVGKKGGSDTPGGVQVSMVALCNYILSHGGWEKMKSDRESKLELLKHFGWDHGLPAGKSAVFKEDKAIQSLTTQVREYFVKTGVFHVLSTNRASADGATTSGGFDHSPTEAQFAAQQNAVRATPELLGTPALHGFPATASADGAANAGNAGHNNGVAYHVPMLSVGPFTDPSEKHGHPRPYSASAPGALPVSCNTDPLPQHAPQEMPTRQSQHGGVDALPPSAPQPHLPSALPLPPHSGVPVAAGGFPFCGNAMADRSTALQMQTFMDAMNLMHAQGNNVAAAQHAYLLAQAASRFPPQGLTGDMDILQQLASHMHASNVGAPLATATQGELMAPLNQMMWAPSAATKAAAAAAAAAAGPATPAAPCDAEGADGSADPSSGAAPTRGNSGTNTANDGAASSGGGSPVAGSK